MSVVLPLTLPSSLGDGIFATDGERWRSQRKATSRVFTGVSALLQSAATLLKLRARMPSEVS